MKKINIITSKDEDFINELESCQLVKTSFSLPLEDKTIHHLIADKEKKITIIDLDYMNDLTLQNFLSKADETFHFIGVGKNFSTSIKKKAMAFGISEIIKKTDAGQISDYINILKKEKKQPNGKILILDNNIFSKRILTNLSERFNFSSINVDSIEELLKKSLNVGVQLILINIGNSNFDINKLIRKAISKKELKNTPIIIFKDMQIGLFMHEFVKGLNLITDYILSPEELYSLLLDLFFRKEMIPLVAKLNQTIDIEKNLAFLNLPIKQVYFNEKNNLFNLSNFFTGDTLKNLEEETSRIQELSYKAKFVKWLRIE